MDEKKLEYKKEVKHQHSLAGVKDKKDENYQRIKNEVYGASLFKKEQKLYHYWKWRVHKLTSAFDGE